MSGHEVDLDALFDRDADSRLLDRRRRDELGLAPYAVPASSTPVRFGPESMVGDTASAAARGAVLRLALEARPDRALIPGAVVTVVASVADDGDVDAEDARLRVAVPPEAEPILDSFARDGVALDGESLLGEGLRIGTIPAGTAVRIRFALRVLPGTEPLDVAAHATAPGLPAIAAPTLRLLRRSSHAAFEQPRPFFELESGETDDDLAPSATVERAGPRAVDALVDEPAAPPVAAAPRPAPTPPPPAPEPVSVPPPMPELAARAADVRHVLARALEAEEVRALERVFAGAVPHGLAALALLSSTAAVDTPLGVALGVRDVAFGVAAALPRALVAARLGRPTPAVVTPAALAAIRAGAPVPSAPLAAAGAVLVTRLDERELDALRKVLARSLDDPFLRGVQVLLAVAPRALDGVPQQAAAAARDALAAYRVAAGAWLMRVTVRRAIDRRFDPLTADDAPLHEAGRALVVALSAAVA